MAKYLIIIFNKSLSSGTLSNDCKTVKVKSIHKSGSLTGPISLTCTAWKLLEHIILKHITKHLEKEEMLTPCQRGFRKGVCTIKQLCSVTTFCGSRAKAMKSKHTLSHYASACSPWTLTLVCYIAFIYLFIYHSTHSAQWHYSRAERIKNFSNKYTCSHFCSTIIMQFIVNYT